MNNIKKVHLIGRIYGEVMHIDPNIELYKIEVYDEKKRSFETLIYLILLLLTRLPSLLLFQVVSLLSSLSKYLMGSCNIL
jgi:hypothetical protein